MLQAFVIVFREGFESFLIVGIILAYLRRIGQHRLVPAMYWGIGASILASSVLGYVLSSAVAFNESLWEGVFGLITIVLVASLVVHVWKAGPRLKRNMETKLARLSSRPNRVAFLGVFLFTVVMITKEGMETVLMLLQVKDARFLTGVAFGAVAATAMAWSWVKAGPLIDIRRFFQVTSIFLLLFLGQIAIYSFHELSEARVLPNSEAFHDATEPFSPDGLYGKWFSFVALGACAAWLGGALLHDGLNRADRGSTAAHQN
jgi:high-affinity iron transporter